MTDDEIKERISNATAGIITLIEDVRDKAHGEVTAAILAVRVLQEQPGYDHAHFVSQLASAMASYETKCELSASAQSALERTANQFERRLSEAPSTRPGVPPRSGQPE